METRNVVDRVDDDFEHGHREQRADATAPWTRSLHGDYVLNTRRFWFQKAPHVIMAEDMGFETSVERAAEFAGASDNDPDMWYYLALASKDHGFMGEPTDEPLKWIMSALAAEVKVRGLRFGDIPRILPAHYLSWFAYAIREGTIDRTMAKAVFAELLKIPHRPLSDTQAGFDFNNLIARPEFKAVSADDLEPIVDRIIADNPGQFDKARENPKLVQWFVGQAMKATGGKASAPAVIAIVNARIAA